MRRILRFLFPLALIGAAAFWWITRPHPMTGADFTGLTGDAARGQVVFTAAGCASCHMAEGATGEAQLVLSGGQTFPSPFGTFVAPNISTDPVHGIGGWTLPQLASAVMRGVTPGGQHLYPALPYASYDRMTRADMADLYAYVTTLPASAEPSPPHQVAFPFSWRRLLGGWKFLFLRDAWVLADAPTPELQRGRYIVEALAHCGECHTPRNALGAMDRGRWLSGVPGRGGAPNITPARLDWSEDEIIEYLTSGMTPDYDSVGGHMAHVVDNMSKLPESDRRAVAAYLKAIPAVE
ncbi:MAG: cytochrome c [Paracoccaceae bacterium]